MDHRTSYGLALSAVGLCTAGLALFAAPATAAHADDHLYALEVFAPEGAPVTQASCGRRIALPGMAAAADLPAGTTAAVDLEGPYQGATRRGSCWVWNIGGYQSPRRSAAGRGSRAARWCASSVRPRSRP